MKKNFPASVPISGRVRTCLELLKSQKIDGKTIIDIGSSFGWLEKEIQNCGAKEIIGIEPNKEAVEFAKKNVRGAKFLQVSALKIPLAEEYADIVLLFDVLEHLPKNKEKNALQEIYRILKKRGVLLLSSPYSHLLANILDPAWYFGHRHYSKEQISEVLSKTGFKVEKLKVKGSIFSCFYLWWFYLLKRITGNPLPRNIFLERLDDEGYNKEGITDIFLIARKV